MCVRVYACVCVCVPAAAAHNRVHTPTSTHTRTHTYPHLPAAGCGRPHRIDPRRAVVTENRRFITRPTHRARAPTALHTAAGPDSPPLQAQRRPLQRRSCGRPHRPKNRLRTYKLDHKRLICALLELPLKRHRAASDTRTQRRRPPARIGETPGSNCLFSNSFD